VRSGWRGEIFLSGEKGTLGDFLWQIGGFGGHRRAWRGKRPPKFSGKILWREGTEVVASQYFLVNQTLAKYGVASQNLAWLFVAGIQTAPTSAMELPVKGKNDGRRHGGRRWIRCRIFYRPV
jgi:hypothetical protein